MPHKRNIVLIILIAALMLSCTSISQFVGMPDPNDPGLDPKDLEDDSISADATARAEYAATDTAEALEPENNPSPQNPNGLDLTPEEGKNSGRHFYLIEGTGTPLLGGDGTYSGEGFATSDFVEGGVLFHLSEMPAESYTRIGLNTYEYKNENVTVTLIYTASGFEYHSIGSIESHYYYELND